MDEGEPAYAVQRRAAVVRGAALRRLGAPPGHQGLPAAVGEVLRQREADGPPGGVEHDPPGEANQRDVVVDAVEIGVDDHPGGERHHDERFPTGLFDLRA